MRLRNKHLLSWASDLPVYLGAVAVVALAGGLASFIPARRAAKVDPMVALRYE